MQSHHQSTLSEASNLRPFSDFLFIATMQRALQLRQQPEQQPFPPAQRADYSPTSEGNVCSFDTSYTDTRKTHGVHKALTIFKRDSIVNRMTFHDLQNGEKHISSKTFRNFSQYFKASENASLTRATRLWKDRNKYADHNGTNVTRGVTSFVTGVTLLDTKRVRMKATPGRGRKRFKWVEALHSDLCDEFDRLQRLGVKLHEATLKYVAMDLLRSSQCDAYSNNMVDPATDV